MDCATSSRSGASFFRRLSFFVVDVRLRIFYCAFLLPGYNEEKNTKKQREVIEHEYFKHQTTDKTIR